MPSAWIAARRAHQPYFGLKLGLRVTSILFTLASVIAAVVIDFSDWVGIYLTVFVAPWAISFVWSSVWLLVHTRRERPIVHGLTVALDLIIFVWYIVAEAFGWIAFTNAEELLPYNTSSSPYYLPPDFIPTGNAPAAIAISSTFALLNGFVHFWLFVHACVDEDRRRKNVRQAKPQVKPQAEPIAVNAHNVQTSTQGVVACVDCAQPVHLRCAQCAAILASQDNTHVHMPEYAVPRDVEAGTAKLPGYDRASIDSVDFEKKVAVRGSLR